MSYMLWRIRSYQAPSSFMWHRRGRRGEVARKVCRVNQREGMRFGHGGNPYDGLALQFSAFSWHLAEVQGNLCNGSKFNSSGWPDPTKPM